MKILCLLSHILLLGNIALASDTVTLFQSRYPGIVNRTPDWVTVGGKPVRLVSAIINNAKSNSKESMQYVVVPQAAYRATIARYPGYKGEADNIVRIRGRKTIVFSSADVDTTTSRYPGIANKPANYVVIDGVPTIIVQQNEYRSLLALHGGIADLPENYVSIDGAVYQVLVANQPTSNGSYPVPGPAAGSASRAE